MVQARGVGQPTWIRALAAVLDADAGRADKTISSVDALDRPKALWSGRQGEAIDLVCVHKSRLKCLIVWGEIGCGCDCDVLMEGMMRAL